MINYLSFLNPLRFYIIIRFFIMKAHINITGLPHFLEALKEVNTAVPTCIRCVLPNGANCVHLQCVKPHYVNPLTSCALSGMVYGAYTSQFTTALGSIVGP